MKHLLPLLLFFSSAIGASAAEPSDTTQQPVCRYRVWLKDKKQNDYSLRHPEAFLSQKALERRKKFGIRPDEADLPVTAKYLQQLTAAPGATIHCTSRWNNTAVVETADSTLPAAWKALPFVEKVERVYVQPAKEKAVAMPSWCDANGNLLKDTLLVTTTDSLLPSKYGYAENQVKMLGADKLHIQQYTGEGVTIAVVDGGFQNADVIGALKQAHILGTHNFVHPTRSVYREADHGMMVLSCIAANQPGVLIGTAPAANFYLLVSEDGESEQPVEEDNWAAAVEYADSVGADIVTSSLGYYQYDAPHASYRYTALDGRTALISRSASKAASRGLLVFNSAGNEGADSWKKIGFPGDAIDMVTVGAVDSKRKNIFFSSIGNTADGRVKPDVMAQGVLSAVTDTDGSITFVNGTSFSCPIMAGAAACVLQAVPTAKPQDVVRALQQTADNAATPDNIYGYGVANVAKAVKALKAKNKK